MMRDMIRGALRSFTVWFNGILGSLLAAVPIVQDSLPQLQEFMTPERYKQAVAVLVIGNLLLRIKTNSSLADKAK